LWFFEYRPKTTAKTSSSDYTAARERNNTLCKNEKADLKRKKFTYYAVGIYKKSVSLLKMKQQS